jgi:hypothetical protein
LVFPVQVEVLRWADLPKYARIQNFRKKILIVTEGVIHEISRRHIEVVPLLIPLIGTPELSTVLRACLSRF